MRKSRSTLFLFLPLVLLACSDEPAEKPEPGAAARGGDAAVQAAGEGSAGVGGAGADTDSGLEADDGSGLGAADEVADSDGSETIGLTPLGGSFGFEDKAKIPDSELANYHVEMEVAIDNESVGTLIIGLWPEHAPIAVRNFLRLCDEGFYAGVGFHRVLRNFMVQGGDPTGSGGGNSPHGTIQAEFSDDPARGHHYGVLAMARLPHDVNSASCQFFIVNDEGVNVWSLDGQYSSFGRLVGGVAALEALSNVKVGPSQTGEPSKPLAVLTILGTTVKAAPAPEPIEEIARPVEKLDLAGEPERITIQHCLISFKGRTPNATRTQEEAEALADDILARAQGGEDFIALIREFSNDPVDPEDPNPGVYRMLNSGVRDMAGERKLFEKRRSFQVQLEEMQAKYNAGEVKKDEYQALSQSLNAEFQAFAKANMYSERSRMVPGFGNVGFRLKVGEVGVADFDAQASPYGWHIIKRLE